MRLDRPRPPYGLIHEAYPDVSRLTEVKSADVRPLSGDSSSSLRQSVESRSPGTVGLVRPAGGVDGDIVNCGQVPGTVNRTDAMRLSRCSENAMPGGAR